MKKVVLFFLLITALTGCGLNQNTSSNNGNGNKQNQMQLVPLLQLVPLHLLRETAKRLPSKMTI